MEEIQLLKDEIAGLRARAKTTIHKLIGFIWVSRTWSSGPGQRVKALS
jgi:hypothetical protein